MTVDLGDTSFLEQIKALYAELSSDDPLFRLRAKGFGRFQEMGLPTKKTDVFKYIPLRKVYESSFAPSKKCALTRSDIDSFVLPECKASVAVFLDGQFDASLSCFDGLSKKIVAIPLEEALHAFGTFINNQVVKSLQEESDPFAALNGSFLEKALFVYVPPGTVLATPLQVLYLSKGAFAAPRVELFFGAGAEAKVVQTSYFEGSEGAFLNSVCRFSLEEGAKVSYSKMSFKGASTSHFDATRVLLKRDSTFKSVCLDHGQTCLRDDYRVILSGENAEVNLSGVKMLSQKNQSHTHVFVHHQAPHCRSMQLFKGVLDGYSRASFEGKIYVDPIAQKTEAFQLNNHLVLSEGSEADSKPNLEIFADDVKASHGSTVGQISQEELFYLRARGLSLDVAKNLLVRGFCEEVIERFDVKSLLLLAEQASREYLK